MKYLPTQILITDTKTIDPVLAAEKLPENSALILRDYNLSFDERFALGKKLKKICKKKHILFLVANDFRLAISLGADGMHFSEFMHQNMRRIIAKKPTWFFTYAVHSRTSAKRAYDYGVDAILVSPIFPTKSHPEIKPLGVIRALHYIYRGIPAYGLGGVNADSAKSLKMADFCGFAGISWVNNCGGWATVLPANSTK